ncbi:MAG: DMT family transporter [Alphaproteobacteria bacterium]|nr:DMT family transporter [Alphaproteobacteria bacterium]
MSRLAGGGDGAPAFSRWFLVSAWLVEAVAFALFVVVNRLASEAGVPNFGYTLWYALGAGLVLLIIGAIKGDTPPLKPRYVLSYLVLGMTGLAFPFTLMAFVAPKLPSGIVSMLVVLSPVMTYVFSLIFRLERFRLLSVIGILLGLAGVLVLILPSTSLPSADMVPWVLLCMLAPSSFGLTNVLAVVLRPPALSALSMATSLLLSAAFLLFPITLLMGQIHAFPGPNIDGDLAILYAVGLNIMIWTVFLGAVRVIGPVLFSQFNYLVVLIGFGFGVLFFGEQPSLYIWLATALMFLGLAAINWRPRQRGAAGATDEAGSRTTP